MPCNLGAREGGGTKTRRLLKKGGGGDSPPSLVSWDLTWTVDVAFGLESTPPKTPPTPPKKGGEKSSTRWSICKRGPLVAVDLPSRPSRREKIRGWAYRGC